MKYLDSTFSENFLPRPQRLALVRAPGSASHSMRGVPEKSNFSSTVVWTLGARQAGPLLGPGRKFSEDVESKYFIVKILSEKL